MSCGLSSYLFGELTGLFRRIEDLIEKDGEIEGEPQTDGVCGLHFLFADVKGLSVGFLRVLYDV